MCVWEGPVTRGLHGMGVASYNESLRVCMCVCVGGTSYQGSPWGMPFLWPSKSLSVSACCS